MALPRRRQQLAKFVVWHDTTYDEVAEKVGSTHWRILQIANGRIYPSPDEIQRLPEAFGGMPVEVLLEAELLKYRNGPWPPRRGRGALPAVSNSEVDR